MGELGTRIWEALVAAWDYLKPVEIINHYDRGVRMRLGKPVGDVLEPGIHWKWPVIDEILSHMVKPTTMNLTEQSLTTKDDKSIVIKGVVKYQVSDVRILLLEVNSPSDALSDMVSGLIRDKVIIRNWSECNDPSLVSDISRIAKSEAKRWGIEIIEFTLTDLAIMKSIRLLNK